MNHVRRLTLTALGLALAQVLLVWSPPPASAAPPANAVPPTLSGTPEVGRTLTVDPGTWTGGVASYRYVWLRDGKVIRTTTSPSRQLNRADQWHRVSVRVIARNADGSARRTTSSVYVRMPTFRLKVKPVVVGQRRWDHRLTASHGRWTPEPATYRYRWYRGNDPIPGATGKSYLLRPADYGRRINVRVAAVRSGWKTAHAFSGFTSRIGHRVPVRKTFTYRIETRGRITTSLSTFVRQAQQTFDHPRGWRSAGYRFRRVSKGGQFSLVLSEASWLPRFSSGCSAMWSCRVGRYVIINQDRWKWASPAWNAAGRSRRDYRHMVVNHETGHWLGHGHAGCGGKGQPAPVMAQQSKGRGGCTFNPFPLPRERWTDRRHALEVRVDAG